MAVLVTGGSGFVGLNVIEALLSRGATVVAARLAARPAARPKWPKGRGQALGPPVAMYFHKQGIEIT